MKLEHLKGGCVFSTHASCFTDFFFCAIFSYICFLKPATMKTEAIFVPVHILQSGQSSVSVPQASRSHPRKVVLPQRNSFFSSVTAQEDVTGNPVNCYFFYQFAIDCIKFLSLAVSGDKLQCCKDWHLGKMNED